MMWINKENKKPLYKIYITDILKGLYENVMVDKTYSVQLLHINGFTATLYQNSPTYQELHGIKVICSDETTQLFAFIHQDIIYSNDKKLIVDTVRNILKNKEKIYEKYVSISNNDYTSIMIAKILRNNIYNYFKKLQQQLKIM